MTVKIDRLLLSQSNKYYRQRVIFDKMTIDHCAERYYLVITRGLLVIEVVLTLDSRPCLVTILLGDLTSFFF